MKGLDWTNERWVRLHTRNTSEWNLLSWQAQNLWLHILRLTDHAGIIPVKKSLEPWESICSHLPKAPKDEIRSATQELLDEGWIVHLQEQGWLWDPECTERDVAMSDKTRQRESRDRRRALAEAESVTKRDNLSRNRSQTSRSVTTCHDVSLQPSLAKPNNSKSSRSGSAVPRQFLSWAVERTWGDHLAQWRAFYQAQNGQTPPEPKLTPDRRKIISDAILRRDRHLVVAEDQDRFVAESEARASGIGIFLDPWCTGTGKDNNTSSGGRRYLEHWRPWRQQQGKGDPIDRFSQLYFEASTAKAKRSNA